MYESHFGFAELPFSNTPDPRFFYQGSRHEEALAHLLFGVRQYGGFVQLTGEVGTGKTICCRYLLEHLPEGVDVAFVFNPSLNPEELLATLCDELGVAYSTPHPDRKALVDALHCHLLQAHAEGRRTVLIVDEAQGLSVEALEQVRLLTNLETAKHKLLQIILIGQPELADLLRRNDLRQLAQRITARYHLAPFVAPETHAYVRHRLGVAGGSGELFSVGALREVHRLSRGVPRLVNVVCDRALLGAYAERRTNVDARTVRKAAREVLDGPTPHGSHRARWWLPLAASVVLAVGAAIAVLGQAPDLLTAPGPTLRRLWGVGEMASAARAVAPNQPQAAVHAPPVLPAVLARSDLRADRRAAFASLMARWGLGTDVAGADPCEAGRRLALECVQLRGGWTARRRFDLPAVLRLMGPGDRARWTAVLAMQGEEAVLAFGDLVFAVPTREIDARWNGAFEVVWRPPRVGTRTVGPGTRGEAVTWLAQRLSELDGLPAEAGADAYDKRLAARVVDFQRRHSLVPDGVVGVETLMRISALLDRRTPSLALTRAELR